MLLSFLHEKTVWTDILLIQIFPVAGHRTQFEPYKVCVTHSIVSHVVECNISKQAFVYSVKEIHLSYYIHIVALEALDIIIIVVIK